jgi:hypothetical protein
MVPNSYLFRFITSAGSTDNKCPERLAAICPRSNSWQAKSAVTTKDDNAMMFDIAWSLRDRVQEMLLACP